MRLRRAAARCALTAQAARCAAAVEPHYRKRLSFCCARPGCRRRVTPPSVRFLGRRLYVAAVVVLVTAMAPGVTPKRAAYLGELAGEELSDRERRCSDSDQSASRGSAASGASDSSDASEARAAADSSDASGGQATVSMWKS